MRPRIVREDALREICDKKNVTKNEHEYCSNTISEILVIVLIPLNNEHH